MRRAGFTLVEVLVYLFLFGIFTFVLIRLDRDMRQVASFSNAEIDRLIREQFVFDIIFRDVVSASCDVDRWDNFTGFVFRKKFLGQGGERCECDVGFESRGKKLFRYEGRYDFEFGRWLEKDSSVIFESEGNRDLTCRVVVGEGSVRSVELCSTCGQWQMRLRNGFL